MSKNKYTNSALKEATNIVEKYVRKKSKKTSYFKLFLILVITLSIITASVAVATRLPFFISSF